MHAGQSLPKAVNIAAQPPLMMADILTAAGRNWCYGPPRQGVISSATLATDRLRRLCGDVPTSPQSLVSEVNKLK